MRAAGSSMPGGEVKAESFFGRRKMVQARAPLTTGRIAGGVGPLEGAALARARALGPERW